MGMGPRGLADLQIPEGFDAWFASAELPTDIREWLSNLQQVLSTVPNNTGDPGNAAFPGRPGQMAQQLPATNMPQGFTTQMPPQGFVAEPSRGNNANPAAEASVDFTLTKEIRNFDDISPDVKGTK